MRAVARGAPATFVARLAVAAALLVILDDEPSRAVVPGGNGRIAFETNRDGNYEIYTMNSSGGGALNVTNNAAFDLDPVLSPDATKIAFLSTRDGIDGDIFTVNADGTGPQVNRTTNAAVDFDPAWSPDGTKLAFVSDRAGNYDIYTMNADGTGPVVNRTTNAAADVAPAWSPDGTKIAFRTTRDGGNSEIYTMNADGTSPVNRTNDAAIDDQPAWSPDGTKIAFETIRGGNSEIYTMNADGTGQVNRSNNAATEGKPAWSPDGTKIAFRTNRDAGNDEIYTMNADGAGPVNRTNNAATDSSPDWGAAPDGDGDGLLDSWEANGIDFTNNGSVDLDLPAMGADPMHKDIFLEIDHMTGHDLSQTAVDDVVAAFAVAPVNNPDNTQGITLHVDNGSTSTMKPGGATWGALSDADTLTHDAVLGSRTFFGNAYIWTEFDTIKTANFSSDREPAFHYVVSGHRYGDASDNSAGISRGIEASDLIVSLGPVSEPGEGSGTVEQQEGTLMHELGHNLGLHHGGDDDRNYKPNYLSVMNYSFNFTGLYQANGTTRLDYSRFNPPLVETDLDEFHGFGFAAGTEEAKYLTIVKCPGDKLFSTPLIDRVTDWNCDKVADPAHPIVAFDVNQDGVISNLAPFLDWPALVYDGGGVGDLGAVVLPQESDLIEPQLDELLANKAALEAGPPPPPVVLAPTTNPPSTGATPEAAIAAPKASLSGSPSQKLGKSISVTVTCSETCDASAGGSVAVPNASKLFKISSPTAKLAKGGSTKLVLKLPKKLRAAAARALKKRKKVKAAITVTVKNAAGTGSAKRTIRLKR